VSCVRKKYATSGNDAHSKSGYLNPICCSNSRDPIGRYWHHLYLESVAYIGKKSRPSPGLQFKLVAAVCQHRRCGICKQRCFQLVDALIDLLNNFTQCKTPPRTSTARDKLNRKEFHGLCGHVISSPVIPSPLVAPVNICFRMSKLKQSHQFSVRIITHLSL